MRKLHIIMVLCLLSFFCQSPNILNAQVLEQDSLALVAVYNSTNGANWTNKTNWLSGNVSTWYGVVVAGNRVTQINLGNNNLSGSLPVEIGDLTALSLLRLMNNPLSGSIPSQIGNCTNLYAIQVFYTQLSGPIPPEIGNLTSLNTIQMGQNKLTGTIPVELGNCTNLQWIELNNNLLSGTIPVQIGNLTGLIWLQLNNNTLSGSIPTVIGNLTALQYLNLAENQLNGAIPPEIGNLTNVQSVYITSNQLNGTIPSEIGSMTNLQYLYLSSNQLNGSIPATVSNILTLRQLHIDNNQLSGEIPSEIYQMPNLTEISLENNQLTGSISEQIGNLTGLFGLFLGGNQLSGSIPAAIGSLTEMKWIWLYGNQFSGSIPVEIINLSKLQQLQIHGNRFSGLPDLSSLTTLYACTIEDNQFTFEDIESNVGISGFTYAPQDSVGEQKDTTLVLGEQLEMSVSVGGTANLYQWMKDEVDILDATSTMYSISSAQVADAGAYICKITNTIATGLTLYSRPVNVTVIDPSGMTNGEVTSPVPDKYNLYQNYPNPFNPVTNIRYALSEGTDVKITVYNLLGQTLLTLVNEYQPVGYYSVLFNAGHLSSGIYLYTISTSSFSQTRKMLLVR